MSSGLPSLLIIGYGNPLRGDDGVGPYVAAQLDGVVAHQLVPEMAEQIAKTESVIFVDANCALPPGQVEVLPLQEEAILTHKSTPGALLKLAREVYGQAPKATLIAIGVSSFHLGDQLTAEAQKGAAAAISQIRQLRSQENP
ncbi:MAG: hydrogenase maturation protease [Bryobacterales bacterium]|nr:hydrogenase maturation protease [Bryobacterales bacterium]